MSYIVRTLKNLIIKNKLNFWKKELDLFFKNKTHVEKKAFPAFILCSNLKFVP